MSHICELSIEMDKTNVVTISGEVDIVTSETLREFLDGIVDHFKSDIMIDCRKLTYIDSHGIIVLLRAQRKMGNKGAGIYLINVNKNIQKLFSIIHLVETFKIAV